MQIKASLPPINIPITDGNGVLTVEWYRHFESVFNRTGAAADKIEQVSMVGAGNSAVAAAALATAAAAQATANAAASGSSAQTQGSTASVDIAGAGWVSGPAVSFASAVSVAHEALGGSGPIYGGSTLGTFNGEMRVMRIVGGVETPIGSTVPFSVAYSPGGGGEPPTSDITFAGMSYSAPDAHTGAVGYRLDARRTSGTNTLTGCAMALQVVRTP